MTKTNNKNPQQKRPFYCRPWVIFLLALILIAAIIIIIIFITKKPEVTQTNQPETESSLTSSATNESEDKPEELPEDPEHKVTQYEGEDPNTLDELTGSITYKGVHDGVLVVTTMINQYLTTEGTCKLTLIDESGVQSYSLTNPAIADVSTSYCQNFSVPTATLKPGKYQINITISSDQKTGTITDEVEL